MLLSGITKSLEENADDSVVSKNVANISDILKSPWVQSFQSSKNETNSEKNFQLKFFAKQVRQNLFNSCTK